MYQKKSDGSWVRGDTVDVGDSVAIFDAYGGYESFHDEACVKSMRSLASFEMEVELGQMTNCAIPYQLRYEYFSSVDPVTHQWSFADGTRSAGVGVVSGCYTGRNLVNTLTSCFCTADTRAIERSFDDAFVEYFSPRWEMGELPYLPPIYFQEAEEEDLARLSKVWFGNFRPRGDDPLGAQAHNFIHLIGATSKPIDGQSNVYYDWIYIYVDFIDTHPLSPEEKVNYNQETVSHECAHQFWVNPDTCDHHDLRDAWCTSNPYCSAKKCIMVDASPGTGKVHELCDRDLLNGAAASGSQLCDGVLNEWVAGEGAIRTREDPR
jgi:hypothetical protein